MFAGNYCHFELKLNFYVRSQGIVVINVSLVAPWFHSHCHPLFISNFRHCEAHIRNSIWPNWRSYLWKGSTEDVLFGISWIRILCRISFLDAEESKWGIIPAIGVKQAHMTSHRDAYLTRYRLIPDPTKYSICAMFLPKFSGLTKPQLFWATLYETLTILGDTP